MSKEGKSEVKAAIIAGICTLLVGVLGTLAVTNITNNNSQAVSVYVNGNEVKVSPDEYQKMYDDLYQKYEQLAAVQANSGNVVDDMQTNSTTAPPTTIAPAKKQYLADMEPTAKIGNMKINVIPLIDAGGLQHSNAIWSNSEKDNEYITYDVSGYSYLYGVLASPATDEGLSYYCNVGIYLDGKEISDRYGANGVYGVKNPESFKLNIKDGNSLKIVWKNQYVEAYPRAVLYDAYVE